MFLPGQVRCGNNEVLEQARERGGVTSLHMRRPKKITEEEESFTRIPNTIFFVCVCVQNISRHDEHRIFS